MPRLALLACLVLATCVACVAIGRSSRVVRPNIILIMADDVGVEAFGCYGGTSYATPHLDRLAAEGVRFTHAYSQPLCTPSRVKLMTGRSNLRNYLHFSILDPNERTFAHEARQAGYATAVVGKWQLLGVEAYGDWAGKGTGPRAAGFDRWCLWQLGELGTRYWDPTVDVDGELRRDIEGAYGPDLHCEYLLDFAAAHRDEPFLAYYPMALVHNPFVPTPLSAAGERSERDNFADMVEYMDAIVGRIVEGLEELGLRERTLILFTGDNGTNRAITSRMGTSRMGKRRVRGGKAHATDAGTHVPLIASWPGTIQGGAVCDDLIDLSDFLPTMLDAMDAPRPTDRVLDGVSFFPQLLGRRGTPREVVTIYSNPRPESPDRNPTSCFARDQRYKLYTDGRFFDCAEDPRERWPLAPRTLDARTTAIHRKLQDALDALPPEPPHLQTPPR